MSEWQDLVELLSRKDAKVQRKDMRTFKILPPLAAKLNWSHSQVEIDEKSNLQILQIANSDKPVVFYNFYVILTVEVGILVKVQRGVALLSLIQRSKKV